MKEIFKKIIPKKYHEYVLRIKNDLFDGYAVKSYSQEGEDIILSRIFEGQREGFYVDVGAHHPKRFSNTYIFYKRGWRGINIEPSPGSMRLFNKSRPRDINLECGVSDVAGELIYYIFDDTALNTFSEELANRNMQMGRRLIKKITVIVYTLADILSRHIKNDKKIDFINIDVESLDLRALQSNDWDRFRPKIILVESHNFVLSDPQKSKIYNYLSLLDYSLFAKTYNTLIFIERTNGFIS